MTLVHLMLPGGLSSVVVYTRIERWMFIKLTAVLEAGKLCT